jgi:hypothetical protein
MSLHRMHRRLDDARRHGIHADSAPGILDRQRLGRSIEPALGQRSQDRWNLGVCVIDQAGGDLDNVTAVPLFHFRNRELRDVEEARSVYRQHGTVVGLRVFREGLGDEDAGIIDKRVDAPEPRQTLGDRLMRRLSVGDVARDNENVGVVGWLHRSRRRHDAVTALPIGIDQDCADSLRRTSDDGDFLFNAHGRISSLRAGASTLWVERHLPQRWPVTVKIALAMVGSH